MSVKNRSYFSLLFGLILALITLAEPAVAQASSQPADPTSYGMTAGRLVATFAAVVALAGVVIGGLALAGRTGRAWTILGFFAGLIGATVGGVRVATASGIGTGGGRAGAIIALALGVIALLLAALALARSRNSPERTEVIS